MRQSKELIQGRVERARLVVCTENLRPDVVVMKSTKDRARPNDSGRLNGARDRRIIQCRWVLMSL